MSCTSPSVNVMPWGPMRIVVNGAPPGFQYKADVVRIAHTKEWVIEVTLIPPPPVRHWAEGES